MKVTAIPVRRGSWPHSFGFRRSFHTTSVELGELAARARAGMLVLYHTLLSGATEGTLLAEIRRGYSGPIVLARDLDVVTGR